MQLRRKCYRPLSADADVTAGRALLVLAIVAGVWCRFHRLGSLSMSADEGAAWAAAVQPVSSLLQLQPQLDSGKLALYDLVLHFWIRMFGDSLSAMRGLSAAIGAISILLIFGLVREIYRCFAEGQPTRGEIAGGFVALMFATNVAMVDTARTARMYPLTIAAELAQILYFIRAQRYGRISNYIGSAIFLALAVAANFTATFVLAGESLWLAYLLIARLWRRSQTDLQITRPAMSLFAGCVLLLPFARGAIAASCNAISGGVLNWIRFQPPLSWSLNVLRGGVGNKSLFLLECALAGFALWRYRKNAPLVPIFIIFMLLGPFVAVMIISLLGRAMMVDRYVLFALVAFLALAASGAEAFASWPARGLVLFLIILLSVRALRHSSGFWVDWREATAIACANSPRNAEIGVVPAYAVNVVRYHLPPERRSLATGLDSACGNSQLLIVNPGHLIPPDYMSQLLTCYPQLVGRATRVEVRSR